MLQFVFNQQIGGGGKRCHKIGKNMMKTNTKMKTTTTGKKRPDKFSGVKKLAPKKAKKKK